MSLSLNESLQILSTLLVILAVVYKGGKIEQKIESLITDTKENRNSISNIQDIQGNHSAAIAVLNQATGVYSR